MTKKLNAGLDPAVRSFWKGNSIMLAHLGEEAEVKLVAANLTASLTKILGPHWKHEVHYDADLHRSEWPHVDRPMNFWLFIQYCQYDRIAELYRRLLQVPEVTAVKPASPAALANEKLGAVELEFNIAKVPTLAHIARKKFPVRFVFYDAHANGF